MISTESLNLTTYRIFRRRLANSVLHKHKSQLNYTLYRPTDFDKTFMEVTQFSNMLGNEMLKNNGQGRIPIRRKWQTVKDSIPNPIRNKIYLRLNPTPAARYLKGTIYEIKRDPDICNDGAVSEISKFHAHTLIVEDNDESPDMPFKDIYRFPDELYPRHCFRYYPSSAMNHLILYKPYEEDISEQKNIDKLLSAGFACNFKGASMKNKIRENMKVVDKEMALYWLSTVQMKNIDTFC
ncbi:hypothetical protein SNEBB_003274 [Seison nebaliae]|nr:hypothetical protein SNEBB_003274 [Seison nebaliae]